MSRYSEPVWKQWLDRLLMVNVFLVFTGAMFFTAALVGESQGKQRLMEIFQKLWQPLFTPAISLLILAALLSGILSWWQRKALLTDRNSEN